MANLSGVRIGCAMTGSFCTFDRTFAVWEELRRAGAELLPIMSFNAYELSTRFMEAEEARRRFREITGKLILHTLPDVEPLGPKKLVDLLIVLPCTGNTLAKLARGIADTPVTLAVKSVLRNGSPVLLGVSTNDGLTRNGESIGILAREKHVYFIPYGQDDSEHKPGSLVADFAQTAQAAEAALRGEQMEPRLTRG